MVIETDLVYYLIKMLNVALQNILHYFSPNKLLEGL